MEKEDMEYALEEEVPDPVPVDTTQDSTSLHTRGFGSLRIQKGKLKEDSLFYSWDAVPMCRELDCPIVESCTYVKGPTVKCHVHYQFLKSLSVVLYRNFSDVLDESKLYRVGMHMMPLYKMLCKLLIEEHAVQNAVYEDGKGIRRAHPVFKEVRDTLQAISKEWRSLGLHSPGSAGPGLPSEILKDPLEYGDPDFHASLEEDSPRRLKRRQEQGGNGGGSGSE
jgi:hypothetical protein